MPGYVNFVRQVVGRYGANPGVSAFVIGNEANINGNPGAADGAFRLAYQAVTSGTVAAVQVLARSGSSARVGVNFAVTSAASDSAFLQRLASSGGNKFLSGVQFVGVDVYPGLWPAGTGQPYQDAVTDLQSARTSVNSVANWRNLPIDILEIGSPMIDEATQAARLTQFVTAILDNRERLQIASLNWFDLWDANSQSSDAYSHYGLLRSDLGEKPAFLAYQGFIAATPH